ncbi:nucleotide-binding protein [Azospirillum argentinense]|nr:division plane positioning ATPase MipZ [Azospirillum argentinense]
MKKVLVTQGKGGGPKTATARNLAVAATVAGQRVATLDTDP